jgi:AcrR family transcriptional regulator
MSARLNPAPSGEAAQRILSVAVQTIETAGESALRIADVMLEADVQAPMIYRHFGDRAGLVQSAQLARAIHAMTAVMDAFSAASEVATDAAAFRRALATLIGTIGGPQFEPIRREHLEVIGTSVTRRDLLCRIRDLHEMVVDVATSALGRAQRAGWVRAELDVRMFAEWGVGSMLAFAAAEQVSTTPDLRENWFGIQLMAVDALLFGSPVKTSAHLA